MAAALIYGTPDGMIECLHSIRRIKSNKMVCEPTSDFLKIETSDGSIMEGRFGAGYWTFTLLHRESIHVQELPFEYPELPNEQTQGLFLYGEIDDIKITEL